MKTRNPSMKQRETELGDKEYFEITMGQSPPGNSYNTKGEGLPFFQGKAEFTARYPIVGKWTSQPSKIAESESILMSVRAPVGDINLSNIKCCIGRGLASIKPTSKVDLMYLYYYLKLKKEEIASLGSGSTFKAITSKQLASIKIPLPPLPVQKAIVSILEKAEKLKQQRAEADKLTQEYLQSVFYEMFVGKDFEMVELGRRELFDIQSGGTPSKAKKEYWDRGSVPWIGSTACKDKPIKKAEIFITDEGLKNSSARLFPKSTVLVALVGATIGKTGFLEFECSTNQNVAGIIAKNTQIDPLFLFYATQTLYPKFISLSSESFKMANLTFIRSLKIPLPPINLQRKFAAIVEKVESMKEQQKKSKLEIDGLFNSLMQRAFKGELVK